MFGLLLSDLLVHIVEQLLEIVKHLLVVAGRLELLLEAEVGKSISLLHLKVLLDLLLTLLSFFINCSKVILELLLDLKYSLVHLLLLLDLILLELLLHLLKFLTKLLSLHTACIKPPCEELVLPGLILLHHVFNRLNLVLELVDETSDLFALSSLLTEHVVQVLTAVKCASNLLLQHGVLLGIDLKNGFLRVLLKVLFELFIFLLLPILELFLVGLGLIFTHLLFLFSGVSTTILGIVVTKRVHVVLGSDDNVLAIFAAKDHLVGSKNALELSDLVIQFLGLLIVIRR